jgi:hypothetical protein
VETGAIAIEGESVGFANYGRGTKWQVRFFRDLAKVRYDVRKPITHLNLEVGPFNFHIPPW